MINLMKRIASMKMIGTVLIVVIMIYSMMQGAEYGFDKKSLFMIGLLIMGNLALMWTPKWQNKLVDRLGLCIISIISPFVIFYFVERFNSVLICKIERTRFWLNVLIVCLVLLLIYFIFNSIKIAIIASTLILSAVSLINFYIFSFRGMPVLAADLTSIKTALNVSVNYSLKLNSNGIVTILGIALFLLVVFRLKAEKKLNIKKRIVGISAYLILLGFLYSSFYNTSRISGMGIYVNPWYPQESYQLNGFMISFMITTKDVKIKKPLGYSLEMVDNIVSDYLENEKQDINIPKVNIIGIMNETFSDLKLVGDFETSEDYMPFMRNLTENSVKGTLYVSVFGGNTANSEFEFLTGNTLAFLPPRCVPYQIYIRKPFASLTQKLKAQGYVGNKAIHPYHKDGWRRDKNYPLLGFEQFISIEDFENPELVRTLISDQTSYNKIIEEYEAERSKSNDPFYVFNVTMQNHGPYDMDYDNLERNIKMPVEAPDDEVERYINLIKKSDEAFEKLVDYFGQVKEPTAIVLFGDHQPAIHNEFYEGLIGKSVAELSAEEAMTRYQVPFIIWTNYEIENKTYDKLSANYLASLLLDTVGSKKTGFDNFLMELSEQVPVITANGYYGVDGKFYQLDEESPYSDILNKYQILQYNNMFDKKNRRSEFFSLASQ